VSDKSGTIQVTTTYAVLFMSLSHCALTTATTCTPDAINPSYNDCNIYKSYCAARCILNAPPHCHCCYFNNSTGCLSRAVCDTDHSIRCTLPLTGSHSQWSCKSSRNESDQGANVNDYDNIRLFHHEGRTNTQQTEGTKTKTK